MSITKLSSLSLLWGTGIAISGVDPIPHGGPGDSHSTVEVSLNWMPSRPRGCSGETPQWILTLDFQVWAGSHKVDVIDKIKRDEAAC